MGSEFRTESVRGMVMDNRDRVMVELDEYLTTQEENYVDPAERKREMAERAADEAMSTWAEE
mgnify:CR=1 FL=1